ncbi:MAG: hypothetical protein AB1458_17100, partial [Bacteroidota bacterium]
MSIASVIGSFNPYAVSSTSSVQTASTPYSPVSSDTGSSAFGGDMTSISSMVANGAGGGFASYKLGAQMGQNMKSI